HSKELLFGLGAHRGELRATIQWPSGLVQHFDNLSANRRIRIEEGSDRFMAEAFASPPASYSRPGVPPTPEQLPHVVGTWLVEPLKAPEFGLPDMMGKPCELKTWQGRFVLLSFYATASEECLRQLRSVQKNLPSFEEASLLPVALNIDGEHEISAARAAAEKERLAFPVLMASAQVAGIYNLIYRHLFDRRRDLPLPVSFLLDREGMIVKVYQGPADADQILNDLRFIPSTASQRLIKALPFEG